MIEGNDCTFVSDFSKIQLQSNTETLGEHKKRGIRAVGQQFTLISIDVSISGPPC